MIRSTSLISFVPLILILIFCESVQAQDYHFEIYGPQNATNGIDWPNSTDRILNDDNGGIWLYNEHRSPLISLYDGKWKSHDYFGRLRNTPDGEVWVLKRNNYTPNPKIHSYNGEFWIEKQILGIHKLHDIAFDEDGGLWMITKDNSLNCHSHTYYYNLYKYDINEFLHWKLYTITEISVPFDFHFGANGLLYGINSDGITKFINGQWEFEKFEKYGFSYSNFDITNHYIDRRGTFWITTLSGLIKFTDSNFVEINTSNSQLTTNSILCISEDLNGNIWLGTKEGLIYFNGNSWKSIDKLNSNIPNRDIYDIFIDYHGNVWAAMGDVGVAKCVNCAPGKYLEIFNDKNTIIKNAFPNPFKSYTQVYYTIEEQSKVLIKILDIYGNDIQIVYNGIKEEGKHTTYVNTEALKKGIYFCRVQVNDRVETIKFVSMN